MQLFRSCCRSVGLTPCIALAAAALILTGCVSNSGMPPSLDEAALLMRSGDQAGAGHVYEALAQQNSGPHRTDLALLAAQAYLAAHLASDATRALSLVVEPLTPEQSERRTLVEVEMDVVNGQPEQAWQRINAMNLPRNPPDARAFLKLKQRVAFATGRVPDAISAEDQLEPWLTSAQEIRQARLDLLQALQAAAERGVSINPLASADTVVRGWLELAPLAAAAARGGSKAPIQAWLLNHPTHPATQIVRSELLAQHAVQAPSAPPAAPLPQVPVGETRFALLLPLHGPTGGAALSVQDGFMTAYYQSPVADRPLVRVYDTSATTAAAAITQAMQDGATFIIGPLTREAVLGAADLAIQRPPILALNFLPEGHPTPSNFYQFALSPEDEARDAARRILADGHREGVVLVPIGDWGTRVLNAFEQEMQADGGKVFASAQLDTSDTDYSDSVTQVLGIQDSRERHRRLEELLGMKLAFEPRRRGDIQYLFTPAQADVERLLRPQLRFHYAGDIPTYATSAAFVPDPQANQDLEGLIFPDMPWMLGGGQAEAVRDAANAAWPTGGPRRDRLFAFGYDAYRLAMVLRTPGAPVQIDGLTGELTLDAQHRIHRELNWAQVHNGVAQLLPPASTSASAQ